MGKILHMVPGLPFGGAQVLAIDLAAKQRESGLDASLLLLNPSPRAADAAGVAGVPIADCGSGPLRMLRARRQIRGAVILHLHIPPPWLAPILPSSPTKLLHLHVRPSAIVHAPSARTKLDSWGARAILKRMDRVIAISDWIAAAWQHEFPDVLPAVSVVHNGIALPAPSARPDGPFTISIACRLADRKGVEEFIELARILHLQAPDMQFRIAGDGPDRPRFENMADEAGLSKVMHFEGFVTDMQRFWSKAHLAAFTPPFEPFGLRLIEPVGHGVPVIAYLTNSGSDEVVAKCRGITAVPYGEADNLAARALELRDDRAELAQLATDGRADVAAHFSLDTMTAAITQAYHQAGAE